MDMRVVEMEWEDGGRFWSAPMPASEVSAYIARHEGFGCTLSDIDIPAQTPSA